MFRSMVVFRTTVTIGVFTLLVMDESIYKACYGIYLMNGPLKTPCWDRRHTEQYYPSSRLMQLTPRSLGQWRVPASVDFRKLAEGSSLQNSMQAKMQC